MREMNVCFVVFAFRLSDNVIRLVFGDFDCSTRYQRRANGSIDWTTCTDAATTPRNSAPTPPLQLHGGTPSYSPFTYFSQVSMQQVIYEQVARTSSSNQENTKALLKIIEKYRVGDLSISKYCQSNTNYTPLSPTAFDVYSLAIVFLLIIHRTASISNRKALWCKYEMGRCPRGAGKCSLAHVLLFHDKLSTVDTCPAVIHFHACIDATNDAYATQKPPQRRVEIPADVLPKFGQHEIKRHADGLERAKTLDSRLTELLEKMTHDIPRDRISLDDCVSTLCKLADTSL